jgi:hypothetical protein
MQLRAAVKRLPFAGTAYALLRLARGRKARFIADYRQNSGVGSDLEITRPIAASLPGLLQSLSVRSMLDIPCGDFLWMRHVDLESTIYTGGDIIETLVDAHQRLHASPERSFRVLDIVASDLPKADLIFCRDCLVHFSHRLVKRAINNIKRSGSTYLLTTTFPGHATNAGIVTGTWQPLNLCAPPFNFPAPIRLINEGCPPPHDDKSMGLWRIRDLPAL